MPPIEKVYVSADLAGVKLEEGIVVVTLREPQGAASARAFTVQAAEKLAIELRAALRGSGS